jgi:hypothetical protein
VACQPNKAPFYETIHFSFAGPIQANILYTGFSWSGKPKQRAWVGMSEINHRKHSKGRRRQICLGKLKGRHVRKSLARHYFACVFMVF